MNHPALAALLAENNWHLLPYHLPLRNKLTTKQESDSLRKGLLLFWQSDVGIVYGEVAPLPGLHLESLDEAKLLVQNHFPHFIKELEEIIKLNSWDYFQLFKLFESNANNINELFDNEKGVLIMAENPEIRNNRLNLLGLVRNYSLKIADFTLFNS